MRAIFPLAALLVLAVPALAAPASLGAFAAIYEHGTQSSSCVDRVVLTIERSPADGRARVRILDVDGTSGCAPFVPASDEFDASSCVVYGDDLDCLRATGNGDAGTWDRLRTWGTRDAEYYRARWDATGYDWTLVGATGGAAV